MKETSQRSGNRPFPTPNYSFPATTVNAMKTMGPSAKQSSMHQANGIRRFKDATKPSR